MRNLFIVAAFGIIGIGCVPEVNQPSPGGSTPVETPDTIDPDPETSLLRNVWHSICWQNGSSWTTSEVELTGAGELIFSNVYWTNDSCSSIASRQHGTGFNAGPWRELIVDDVHIADFVQFRDLCYMVLVGEPSVLYRYEPKESDPAGFCSAPEDLENTISFDWFAYDTNRFSPAYEELVGDWLGNCSVDTDAAKIRYNQISITPNGLFAGVVSQRVDLVDGLTCDNIQPIRTMMLDYIDTQSVDKTQAIWTYQISTKPVDINGSSPVSWTFDYDPAEKTLTIPSWYSKPTFRKYAE